MKLLLASLLLIGTLGKLSCARHPTDDPEIIDDSWLIPRNYTNKRGSSGSTKYPSLFDHKVVNFGKFKNGDLLLKTKSLYKPREKGAKGIIKERLEFAAENGQKIDQVRLVLISDGKTYKGQSYKIWPKSLRRKPARNVTVEVFNKKKGGILADVKVFGH